MNVINNDKEQTLQPRKIQSVKREEILPLSESISNWNQVSEQTNNGLETLINLL